MKNYDKVKSAKLCYEHIGGKLGQLLLEVLIAKGWLAKTDPSDRNLYITELGESQLTAFGIDLSQIKS
ncbi:MULTISPECIES: ArsR family transcriptional regulator [Sphingobacterium]|uniref:ArsR family transcriptional regulator n=1 Tax=Sphingobacterium TaxID=28453 RepID=UPI000B492E05|nr:MULTISPECIES: ArsR family transcriptional regulator [Sphingobacterium]